MKYLDNVSIAHHTATWTSLIEEELLAYLKNKSRVVTYMTHPFKGARDNIPLNTKINIYKKGNLVDKIDGPSGFGSEVIFFVKDLLFNLFYFLFKKEKIDLFFGVDNLNALSGIILKKLGKVDKVVYYVIDYVPKRFKNPILNSIYHWVDFFCVKNADQTWNLSSEMEKARIKDGLSKKYSLKQITVPVGCRPLNVKNVIKSNRKAIVFLGNLSKDQGVDLLIDSTAEIIKRFKDLKLVIVGSGKEEESLRGKVSKLKIERFIEFKGFVKDNEKVNKILADCNVGVAPYKKTSDSFKYFTDPGKIKTYLGAGLPIIMTDISHIAKLIKEREAGLVIDDNGNELVKAVIKIFSDQKYYNKLRQNAIKLAKEFSWKNIFKKAFFALEKV